MLRLSYLAAWMALSIKRGTATRVKAENHSVCKAYTNGELQRESELMGAVVRRERQQYARRRLRDNQLGGVGSAGGERGGGRHRVAAQ